MKIVIIVPTYNERDNIAPLLESLQTVFRFLDHDMHILVVDDRSPDGTGDIVRRIQQRYSNIHLLEGPKKGLGDACIRGFHHAIRQLSADVLFEMDADFSHNPEDIPRMLREIEYSFDVVIGSRYVRGGSVTKQWGLYRKLISRAGNMVARYVAGIEGVLDCTGGFRAISADIVKRIDWSAVQVQGYTFQVAFLHAAASAGARIKEVPIHFADRRSGKSKLGLPDTIKFVLEVWRIRS